jgi:hypothetical protein
MEALTDDTSAWSEPRDAAAVRCAMPRPRRQLGRAIPSHKLDWIRKEARKRKLAFEISIQQYHLLYPQRCRYCGEPSHGGLDRIDSKLGYLLSNVQACCHICNKAKGELTEAEFLRHLLSILFHSGQHMLSLTPSRHALRPECASC